jgi:HEAT repeat protein
MRGGHGLLMLLVLSQAGCGGGKGSTDPRNDVDQPQAPVAFEVRLRDATTLPKRGELPPQLLAALQDDSPHVRRAAVFTVRYSGADAKTISAALTPLLKDRDQFLRVVAAEALWDIEKSPDSLPTLARVLRDGSDLRAATRAIRALGDMGSAAKDLAPELTALLKKPDPELQLIIAAALARIGSADVPTLAEALAAAQLDANITGDNRIVLALARVIAGLGKEAVPPLVTMMKSGDAHKQKVAVLALAELKQDRSAAVPALAGLLRVRQFNTHQTALEVLAHLGTDAEPALLNVMELLDDDDAQTAHLAAVALGNMGRPALQPMLIRLRSKKAPNELAVVALAKIGAPAVGPLLEALKADDPIIRRRAALALGGMEAPPKEVLPVLVELLKEWTADPSVGEAFGAAVGAAGFAVRRRDSFTVQCLVEALSKFPDQSADTLPLLTPLLSDRSVALRLRTACTLEKIGKAARPAVSALLPIAGSADEDYSTASAAARALLAVSLDRKEDVPILQELILTAWLPNTIQAEAVEQLGRLGPDAAEAVPALLDMLATRKTVLGSLYLTNAIGRVGDAALPHVLKAVHTKGKGRDSQMEVLAYLGKPGRDALLKLLTDEDEELREIAANNLGKAGRAPESVAAMLDALNDLDGEVRTAAAESLFAVGTEARVAVPLLTKRLLDPKPSVRIGAALTLYRYGAEARPAVPALLDALKDDDKNVRAFAAKALRTIGLRKEDAATLIETVKSKGTGTREAVYLLTDLGDEAKDAAPVLRELRKDERWEEAVLVALWRVALDGPSGTRLLDRLRQADKSTRYSAASALGGKGSAATLALPALCDALRDPDGSVRSAACAALGHMGAGARPALPELTALLQHEDEEIVLVQLRLTLTELKATAKEVAPAVKAHLKKIAPREQAWWYSALWNIAPDDEVLPALCALLANREACASATRVLGEIGPAAKTAVPALREQLGKRELSLRDRAYIEEALRKIEAK